MMNNTAYSDNTPKPSDVQKRLQKQLPSTWQVELAKGSIKPSPDAILNLCPPDGRSALMCVDIRRRLDPVSVPLVLERSRGCIEQTTAKSRDMSYLVVAPYLSERTRDKLRGSGLNYLDFTGNTSVIMEDPAVYIQTQGANKNPHRASRPMRSLRGAKTAQIVRALMDFRSPLGVRQIAAIVETDPGNVSRVLDLLEREDLIQRSPQGSVQQVNWSELLRAWSRDYSMTGSNTYSTYLDPRGLTNFLSRLGSLPGTMKYAVTGSLAAARLAPVAPARLAVAFVEDAAAVAGALGLVPAEAGANIMLLEPKGNFVFNRSAVDTGVRYVAPSQAAADLLTGSGRNPAEAEELLEWMKRNEDAWRI